MKTRSPRPVYKEKRREEHRGRAEHEENAVRKKRKEEKNTEEEPGTKKMRWFARLEVAAHKDLIKALKASPRCAGDVRRARQASKAKLEARNGEIRRKAWDDLVTAGNAKDRKSFGVCKQTIFSRIMRNLTLCAILVCTVGRNILEQFLYAGVQNSTLDEGEAYQVDMPNAYALNQTIKLSEVIDAINRCPFGKCYIHVSLVEW
ncbi:hypothetical protein NDU88_005080 [Pleurodeles waltl]|uniref:Uncharacterized protein n=1 Tax=Pleurodeles waltl TaxID=8319 RepID=A0AAV7NPI5_PLEWA|nr:hypothetical protein NDU88_005080 [Pleurodeles waltl]